MGSSLTVNTGAHHPKPSSTPGKPGCTDGHLEVRDKNGKSLGYVRNTVNSFGQYGLTNSADNRLIVSIDLEAAKSGAGDIKTKVCLVSLAHSRYLTN
jgi:hypothetical protein